MSQSSEPPAPRALDRLKAFVLGLDAHERHALGAEREAAARLLATHGASKGVHEAAVHAMSTTERVWHHHVVVLQPTQKIACKAGCHWCCYMKVTATAAEVFALAQHLRASRSADAFQAVQTRVAELAQDPRILSDATKVAARIPCALLSDAGACSVHEARPLACRGWNAMDPESCKRSLDDEDEIVPTNLQLARDCAVVGLGLLAALEDAGLPTDLVELNSGLDVALNEPHALERWLAGEPIFARARADRDD